MRPVRLASFALFTTGLLGFSTTGCEKSTRPVADNPPASSSGSSSAPGSASDATASAAPASSKHGPAPDDPMLANVAPAPMPPAEVTKSLAGASNGFAFDFWPRVGKTPGNAAFSPASMSVAFAMTWPGAKGETAAQIKKVMRFSQDAPANANAWGMFGRALSSPGRPVKLRIANRLFGEKTYTFEAPFLDLTKNAFGAPMELVDFKASSDASRVHINDWVSEKTEQRIKDLLPPNGVNPNTLIVLVNALYFLGDWEEEFEKKSTTDEPFDVGGATRKSVPTMHATHPMALAQADGAKVVELRYKRGEASMFVVVPDKKDGLPALEKSMTAAKLEGWMKAAKSENVALSLPRFEVTTPSLELGKEFAALGMTNAFDREKADFTAMANPPSKADRIYIAKVFHKAFVKVDEKGTEAAAATAIVGAKGGGAPAPPVEVKVDHPFLYFVVDKSSGLVLFMGRVDDPTATGNQVR